MTLRQLFAHHGRTIGLGYALALLSSFGQTFFISLSVPNIRDAFGLSNGAFGFIYSTATLSSGLLMIWAGSVIDRINIRLYATAALIGLAGAALSLSVAPNLALVGLSLFGLRLFGQGMLSHAAVTSTARLPTAIRGRAVGVATLGFPTGEATLPGIGLALIATLGWAGTWRVAALTILALLSAGWLVSFLIGRRDRDLDAPVPTAIPSPEKGPKRIALLRDRRLLIFLPALIAPPAILTAFFFHQRYIADMRGWSLEILATGITTYAVVSVVTTMTTGSLVDRFGAVRLSHVYLLGLCAASLTLAAFQGPATVPVFFGLMGLTAGGNNVVMPAVLAELFGTRHLGTVRALAGAIGVVASAATPGLVGLLFDAGMTPAVLGMVFAAYLALATGVTFALPNPRAGKAATLG